ncbi:ommochrome-binding protein-like [Maniola hyperantus]|uniref:ommochrome-binding protein-like n=1 Tax=Aphantopus hyperantus TaxID=2795564 RepID=UPI00156A4AC1|nr:ommochrome-binding protein-like [Maniola hyperantus]
MEKFIIFTIYAIITAQAKRLPCYACLNSVCYSPYDKIFRDQKLSGQLAIDRTVNTIYYHYQEHGRDFTKAFDLNRANSTFIPLNFTFALTVDQSTRDLYLSAEKGVYKYNPLDNITELYGLKDKTIWHMQYADKFYYTEFRHKGLFTVNSVNKKKSVEISELNNYQIDDFIIDKRGDVYFMSNSAIYVFRNGSKKAELFQDEIYFLTTDKHGEAYFIQPYTRGIYKINYRNKNLEEVGAFKRGLAFKVVFDGDNHIVFYESTNKILYYLSPVLSRCTVTTRGVGKARRKFVVRKSNRNNVIRFSQTGILEPNYTNKTSKITMSSRSGSATAANLHRS